MKRFAVYFAPPSDAPLTRLASAWLGRSGEKAPRGDIPEEIWRKAVLDPRVYGFHATLKPPFRLKPGCGEEKLFHELRHFATGIPSFFAPPLKVSALSSFLALTLSAPCPELDSLAGECVREFDHFREAPTEEELARRRRPKPNGRQLEYLERWGYPYVMEEWRFHMTLTSSLDGPWAGPICTHLTKLFAPYCLEPILIDSICIFEQPGSGEPFGIAARFPFA